MGTGTGGRRRRPPRGSAAHSLAEALCGLRQVSHPNVDTFTALSGLSPVRVRLVESGLVAPDRPTLTAYLETCAPNPATRERLRGLWSLSASTRPQPTPPTQVVPPMADEPARRRR
ncbi:hypothetical protein [Actinokineospora globicatena]|uniref:hypothetical protein n=1 Tax=Actinokineospora globicatena TaxID=103729 RepID=UPI0020A548CF|nr:hypothetical protein [Actinokineospora globicatena]GLW75668.1 hypothetical protein Aglo01_01500 [Actinokineospora globicatena]GLW82509.1 hypothetical protein Aglo02_01500 [Actinokineospora globicatena]